MPTVTREAWTDERLDDLNEKVDRGFDRVDRRFEQVDRRFEQVDRRFEQVDRRFDEMHRLMVQGIIAICGFMITGFASVIAFVATQA